jgi:hypothetical protein
VVKNPSRRERSQPPMPSMAVSSNTPIRKNAEMGRWSASAAPEPARQRRPGGHVTRLELGRERSQEGPAQR